MQSRIYHYEIDRAVVNAIYAAHNSQDGTPVTLYEWTPPAADRAAAKLRLAEFLPELVDKFGVEAFTSDASLYLTAHNLSQASDAIAALQARNLFLGFQVIAPNPQLPAPDPLPVPGRELSDRPSAAVSDLEPILELPAMGRALGQALAEPGIIRVVILILVSSGVLVGLLVLLLR